MPNTSTYSSTYLPSLVLKEIFEILTNDIITLHSCTQVNLEWFREASPLLWYDPFSNKTKTHLAIRTYIQEMSLQAKHIIKEHFNISRFEFTSLLPYTSFLRLININCFMNIMINFWQNFRKNSKDFMIKMISNLLIQLMLNKSTAIRQFKFVDLYFFCLSRVRQFSSPVIKLILLCNSSLETLKNIGPCYRDKIEKIFEIAFEYCPNIVDLSIGLITCNLDYLEISWAPSLQYLILYQNHFVVNFKSMKLGDYLEKLAKSLPKYMKVIKIWMVLQGYEDDANLDDLYRFFNNINSRSSFVLLEICIPYNTQVVSKRFNLTNLENQKKSISKNLKNLISYNTSVDITLS
ncbi:hypothetical protein F8M41_017104 [Gigaspora margarita]|uniref:F-box domain-containing protein n=1 Tax=Gigaspora margarita TaxID=4874 RepID=A0A8H4EMG4_GIGMA|nr:hypothetical protein F8M41_017104 [Gigaspora margarita]